MFAAADLYPNKVFRASPVVKWKKPNDHTLTVVVGPQKTIYWYQPRKILRHSKYLRTELLASLMKSRQQQRDGGESDSSSSSDNNLTLSLPHIAPKDWELMLMYMDPTKRRQRKQLNLYDAARLRQSFAKCGFQEGTKLCDEVLTRPPQARTCL